MILDLGRWGLWLVAFICVATSAVEAAELPGHTPLRLLIISDEVNPHALPPEDLTQPGEISVALRSMGSGLNLDPDPNGVVEIATDDLAEATSLLLRPLSDPSAYDVVIYFAHRIPAGPNGSQDQENFATVLESYLTQGGGVVSFHHGVYETAGKESIQALIGGTATGSVVWNTTDGQNVIDVAPGHFITTNGVDYETTLPYADLPRGIPAGTYSAFNNTPDERYLSFELNSDPENATILFASDYNESGTTHLLGFTYQRPTWSGRMVVYQPGEYQPQALDDLEGNNFQILANAIYFAAFGAAGFPTVTPSVTPSATATLSPTATPTLTPTSSGSPLATGTQTPSGSPGAGTQTPQPSATPTIEASATPTLNPPSPTSTRTNTPFLMRTETPTLHPSSSPTPTVLLPTSVTGAETEFLWLALLLVGLLPLRSPKRQGKNLPTSL